MSLNGDDLGCQFGQERRHVARTGSNFEHTVGGSDGKSLQHNRDDVWLRDCLILSYREWMIFVGLVAIAFRRKIVAGDTRHGSKDAIVNDSPRAQLRLDHALALPYKSVEIERRCHDCESFCALVILLPAAADAHVEADHTVLIASA